MGFTLPLHAITTAVTPAGGERWFMKPSSLLLLKVAYALATAFIRRGTSLGLPNDGKQDFPVVHAEHLSGS
ncbi:MAG: hypothetical protein D6790_10100 [Caldilineae bacterium]|nr:MAG: hypothetical protein D6790_10100 [Caldilineae bacterium]